MSADEKTMSEQWLPSEPTIKVLKLNELSDQHIHNCVQYLKQEYLGCSIDEIEQYESWNALFIIFAIKANKAPAN